MAKKTQIQVAIDELMEKRKALLDQVSAYDAAITALNHAQQAKKARASVKSKAKSDHQAATSVQ